MYELKAYFFQKELRKLKYRPPHLLSPPPQNFVPLGTISSFGLATWQYLRSDFQ